MNHRRAWFLSQNLFADKFLSLRNVHAARDGPVLDNIRTDEPVIDFGVFQKISCEKPVVAADDARRCNTVVVG